MTVYIRQLDRPRIRKESMKLSYYLRFWVGTGTFEKSRDDHRYFVRLAIGMLSDIDSGPRCSQSSRVNG